MVRPLTPLAWLPFLLACSAGGQGLPASSLNTVAGDDEFPPASLFPADIGPPKAAASFPALIFPRPVSFLLSPGGSFSMGSPPDAPITAAGRPAETASRSFLAPTVEKPRVLERHPIRNLGAPATGDFYTVRTPASARILFRASVGLQTAYRYNDNFANTPAPRAVGEPILEVRPYLRLTFGDMPGARLEGSQLTEYYAQIQYLPTQHTLTKRGTSRLLPRYIVEAGRSNPILSIAGRYEYDENVFGSSGEGSPEESYTSSEGSLAAAYHPSAKLALRSEGVYRRITRSDPLTNRSEFVLDSGVDLETSIKTSIGAGVECAHIEFDTTAFGTQNYEQGYFSLAWRASDKFSFQARAGIEWRQFPERTRPKADHVGPVVTAIAKYLPDAVTELTMGLRVHNEPSVSVAGALLQEIRLGVEGRRQLGWNLYARCELAGIRRDYDTGRTENEFNVRPAIGYHAPDGRLFDDLNVELFYQYRRVDTNAVDADYGRNLFGIETTVFF